MLLIIPNTCCIVYVFHHQMYTITLVTHVNFIREVFYAHQKFFLHLHLVEQLELIMWTLGVFWRLSHVVYTLFGKNDILLALMHAV